MHNEVKKRVEDGDIRGLQYVFVNCLDVDPTFEKYKEDFEYCCKNMPQMFARHADLTTHMDNNQNHWTDDYWNGLKVDLLKNFSKERFEHMRNVAKVVYADKVSRLIQGRQREQELELERERKKLEQENKRFEEEIRKNHNVQSRSNSYNISGDQSDRNTEVQLNINKTSRQQEQELELERERKKLEQENKRFEEESPKNRNIQNQPCNNTRNVQGTGGAEIKKVMGAVLVIVALIVVILILIRVI